MIPEGRYSDEKIEELIDKLPTEFQEIDSQVPTPGYVEILSKLRKALLAMCALATDVRDARIAYHNLKEIGTAELEHLHARVLELENLMVEMVRAGRPMPTPAPAVVAPGPEPMSETRL